MRRSIHFPDFVDRPALWYFIGYPPTFTPYYHWLQWRCLSQSLVCELTTSVALGRQDAVQGMELGMHEFAFTYELGYARVDTPTVLDLKAA